jgi:hypothetical protein
MLLVCLMSMPQESKDAKVTPLMSKDLTDFPGKEGLTPLLELGASLEPGPSCL